MGVARRVHLRGHGDTPVERRQPGLISDVTAALLDLGNTKTKNPNQPTQPPGGSDRSTSAAPVPAPTATLANGGPTPTATPGGDGRNSGGGDSDRGGDGTATSAGPSNTGGSVTSTGTQTRTRGTPSEPSVAGGLTPNRGSTASGPDFNSGTVNVNVGNGSSSSGKGGLSDLTSETGTSGGPSGASPSTNVSTLSDGKSSSPRGAIAAAVICILLLAIAIVVFLLRRRSRNRRDKYAIQWWFTRNRTSQSYGDNEALNRRSSSRRSSFATTHDHSKAPFFANLAIPPPPPMAEVGRSNGTDPALDLDIHRRFSSGSATSQNSQFLVVHHCESLQHENCASLQSCTESFPFPKPPPGDHPLLYSKGCEGSGSPKKRQSEMLYIASPPGLRSKRPPLRNPFADNDPFDDSASLPAPLSGSYLEVETVRSRFIPELHDELLVNIGDSVRVVRIFDDGWAFVEKMSPGIPTGEHGLIPLNCFRNLGQNSSLVGKRMSSQGANNA